MRRKKNQLNEEETIKILEEGIDGVLGTISENGYPYTVPVNYVYMNDKIYFHCAFDGHKLENIKRNPLVSFTVIGKNDIVEETFTTDYKSVIVFGKAKVIGPSKEVLMGLIQKYASRYMESGKAYVDKDFSTTQIVEITIDHMTGKGK